MNKIVENKAGCWKDAKPESCLRCYWSQVNSSNQWTGPQRCHFSECLVLSNKDPFWATNDGLEQHMANHPTADWEV